MDESRVKVVTAGVMPAGQPKRGEMSAPPPYFNQQRDIGLVADLA